jgi:hypothetical protein
MSQKPMLILFWNICECVCVCVSLSLSVFLKVYYALLNTEVWKYSKHSITVFFLIISKAISVCYLMMLTVRQITLDNKFQKIFYICDEYVINLFVCIYEVRKGA